MQLCNCLVCRARRYLPINASKSSFTSFFLRGADAVRPAFVNPDGGVFDELGGLPCGRSVVCISYSFLSQLGASRCVAGEDQVAILDFGVAVEAGLELRRVD